MAQNLCTGRSFGCKPVEPAAQTSPSSALSDQRDHGLRAVETGAGGGAEGIREELWLVLLGHGTFDGKVAKFNLRGPDFSADELASWLQPFKRPLAVIDCSSCSAPFLPKLSAPGRVIITATRSGNEENYARFGQYISEAIGTRRRTWTRTGRLHCSRRFWRRRGGWRNFTKRGAAGDGTRAAG